MSDIGAKREGLRLWPVASLVSAGIFCIALLCLFYETTWSMVSIWLRSDTYAHGLLILPISLWLIWNQRAAYKMTRSKPAVLVALLQVPLGFVWLLAWLIDVHVVQQLALVAMLVVGVWSILGHQLARVLAFPLLFLFCAVPMGDGLVAPMMELTATSTVWLIQQSGIPVFREGLYFALPSGAWSVVEACSGSRYLIASVTLGLLYAYLTYQSFWRRVLFMLAAVIFPVLANIGRAYMIVMLGHWSDMKIATGVDHLIYGWVFFGLVIFLLFWLGSFFREDKSVLPTDFVKTTAANGTSDPSSRKSLVVTILIALSFAAAWPLLASTMLSHSGNTPRLITLPEPGGDWQNAPAPDWALKFDESVVREANSYYDLNGQVLGLYALSPEGSQEKSDVVGGNIGFIDDENGARIVSQKKVAVQLSDKKFFVDQVLRRDQQGELLVWSWYLISDLNTSNEYLAKFKQASVSLGFATEGSYRLIVAMSVTRSVAVNQAALQDFLNVHGEKIMDALDVNREIDF